MPTLTSVPRYALLLLILMRALPANGQSSIYFELHCASVAKQTDRRALVESLMRTLSSGSRDDRSMAADTLACLGDAARPAVHLVIPLLADEYGEVQANAVGALTYLGSVAVPELIKALESTDVRILNNACRALGDIGTEAAAALPRLKQIAKLDNPAVSVLAALAVDQITRAASEPPPNPSLQRKPPG